MLSLISFGLFLLSRYFTDSILFYSETREEKRGVCFVFVSVKFIFHEADSSIVDDVRPWFNHCCTILLLLLSFFHFLKTYVCHKKLLGTSWIKRTFISGLKWYYILFYLTVSLELQADITQRYCFSSCSLLLY